jgi:GR25 family glycosyltransferase involved in LPS biosynthesis
VSAFDWRTIDWHVVNLAHRTDRLKHVRKQFSRVGILFQRFEAYKPEDWDGDPAKVQRIMNRTPGAVGCYMSQVACIRKALETGRVTAVCEDDVCFGIDLQKRLEYIAEHLTWDWDVFYLGATFHVPGEWYKNPECKSWGWRGKDAEPTDDPHIMRVWGEWGTYATLVNPANAQKVLDALDENLPNSDGIDHNFMTLGDRLNQFCIVPGVAWQKDGKSDIGKGGVTMFSHFKKLGPYTWQEHMEDFEPAKMNWETGVYSP